MIIGFIALFLIILGVSFFLALRSVKDYATVFISRLGKDYALWEIKDGSQITDEFLREFHHFQKNKKFGPNLSLEVVWEQGAPRFYLFAPDSIVEFWQEKIDLEKLQGEFWNEDWGQVSACELDVKYDFLLPLKLNGNLSQVLDNLRQDEKFWLQVVFFAVPDGWQSRGRTELGKVTGEKVSAKVHVFSILRDVLIELLHVFILVSKSLPETKIPTTSSVLLSEKEQQEVVEIQEKVGDVGFGAKIRIAVFAVDKERSSVLLGEVAEKLELVFQGGINRLVRSGKFVTSAQILAYLKRHFLGKSDANIVLTGQELEDVFSWKTEPLSEPEQSLPRIQGEIILPR